ncbi:sel1 repeat family protein [Pseudomonas sp. MM211]|uniref:tetratricopeptide repeat protein n=1 Tax=Pseudomonas sp. MM211 TaxID=2866808 RepID=UPI001CEC01E4|nr:tetratricopeptide repeat protein [Pseudomonas sp. MM211]UCJ14879.1 sel1 repeat family protein [Pseudomonas sp. MM211]
MRSLALLAAPLLVACTLAAQADSSPPCPVYDIADTPDSVGMERDKAESGDLCAQFNLGFYHYTHQSYDAAERMYALAAEQGNARAAFEIAILYRDGLLEDNAGQRRQWMEKSAELGADLAQIELGIDHWEQRDDHQQLYQAMYWFEQAASQGNTQGQYLLGEGYWADRGVEGFAGDDQLAMRFGRDEELGAYWVCKAAEQGDAQAQFAISEAYSIGRGVPPSSIQRHLWLTRAGDNGHEEALTWLDESNTAWYTRLENWAKRQMSNEVATCPALPSRQENDESELTAVEAG